MLMFLVGELERLLPFEVEFETATGYVTAVAEGFRDVLAHPGTARMLKCRELSCEFKEMDEEVAHKMAYSNLGHTHWVSLDEPSLQHALWIRKQPDPDGVSLRRFIVLDTNHDAMDAPLVCLVLAVDADEAKDKVEKYWSERDSLPEDWADRCQDLDVIFVDAESVPQIV